MSKKRNPMLLADFYKTIHHLAYVPGMDHLVSYWTPRMTRIEGIDKVVMFGLQAYLQEYLVDMFNEEFFNKPFEQVQKDYYRIISNTMSEQAADTTHLKALHDLGYLPIQIKAVAEGTRVNLKTPMFEIRSTVAGYGYLVNYIETLTSVNVWLPMTDASIAYQYRELVNKYFDITVSSEATKRVSSKANGGYVSNLKNPSSIVLNAVRHTACGDFSMRGMVGVDSSEKGSAGHLLSFSGSATIPAIMWLEDFYNADCTKELVGKGVPSTEHSVMSSYGRDGEFECYRHLIEDVFKTGLLSIVSDTYDYWNVITNYLPRLKHLIMSRDGKIIIRGDSGDPVDIVCGEADYTLNSKYKTLAQVKNHFYDKALSVFRSECNEPTFKGTKTSHINFKGFYYKVVCEAIYKEEQGLTEGNTYKNVYDVNVSIIEEEETPALKGTVELLWDIFGGHINAKGYKVLDSHIGAIYGDGITIERARAIYARLEAKGFAVNNCTLGIGSWSYLGKLSRDSLGFALKATHSVVDGVDRQIYKDPVTDTDNFKKSQRGMCFLYREGEDILYKDGYTMAEVDAMSDNLLQTVFKDGKLVKEYSLKEIRDRLHNSTF